MIASIFYVFIFLLSAIFSLFYGKIHLQESSLDNIFARMILQQYQGLKVSSEVPIKLVGEKDAVVVSYIERK